MRNSRFTTQQVTDILAEAVSGMTVAQVCAKHGISVPTFYLWRAKHSKKSLTTLTALPGAEETIGAASPVEGGEKSGSGNDLNQLRRRISLLEQENELLRKLFVEASLARLSSKNLPKGISIPDIA
jgi:transposase-like protein